MKQVLFVIFALALLSLASSDFFVLQKMVNDTKMIEGEKGMNNPTGVFVGETGMYVADKYNNRIIVFDKTFSGIKLYGSGVGFGAANFLFPGGVSVDEENGLMYVADTGNDAVKILSFDETIKDSMGKGGIGEKEFSSPEGVFFKDGSIYVVDTKNNRIQKIFSNKTYDMEYGAHSTTNNLDYKLDLPKNVFVLDEEIFAADTNNDRVQVFLKDGTYSRTIGTQVGLGKLSQPSSVFVTAGRIYVADTGHNRVAVYYTNGTFAAFLGEYGTGDYQFREPKGIYVYKSQLYVADSGNNRIMVYGIIEEQTVDNKGKAQLKLNEAKQKIMDLRTLIQNASDLGITFQNSAAQYVVTSENQFVSQDYVNSIANSETAILTAQIQTDSLNSEILEKAQLIASNATQTLALAEGENSIYNFSIQTDLLSEGIGSLNSLIESGDYESICASGKSVMEEESRIKTQMEELREKLKGNFESKIKDLRDSLNTQRDFALKTGTENELNDLLANLTTAENYLKTGDLLKASELIGTIEPDIDSLLQVLISAKKQENAKNELAALNKSLSNLPLLSFLNPIVGGAKTNYSLALSQMKSNPDSSAQTAIISKAALEKERGSMELVSWIAILLVLACIVGIFLYFFSSKSKLPQVIEKQLMKKCKNCGTMNSQGLKYCHFCGAKL